jgi:predicted TIM-barrel fold metal-dependent hydrolase
MQGASTPAQALDRAGIDVEFANRIAMGAGLSSDRFRWVPFDDPLIFPLDNRMAGQTPDTRALYPLEAKLLKRYLADLGSTLAIPPTLAGFEGLVLSTLRRQHDDGARAIKFEVAYLRSFDFANPDTARAEAIYAQYAGGGTPSADDVKILSDALFRFVAREAGKLGMAVHLHALEFFGGYYNAEGARPGLLEPVFNDSTLRGTNFVLIHGGWPHVGETEAMLAKPNVYADISMMDLVLAPEELATVLRGWLMRWPDKVLFGTDAFDGGPKQTWMMGAWVASTTARRALGMALTAMVRDGDITMAQARLVARKVLRDNAIALYHLR